MKAYVIAANRVNGTSSKTGKSYDVVFTQAIFIDGEKREVDRISIAPSLLPEGEIPSYGQVLELSYNRRGFIDNVKFVKNEKFSLNILSTGADKN